uniref:thioredoxin-dependent peroxiredoxin n=1 Tax=Brugia malayi TaxID=6279 RepID=A0A1I9G1Q0_BRUMA|nr:Bm13772, isoform b [Brugia malayi]
MIYKIYAFSANNNMLLKLSVFLGDFLDFVKIAIIASALVQLHWYNDLLYIDNDLFVNLLIFHLGLEIDVSFSTFVCPTEITAFSDRCAEFQKLNTELIACSCDSHFSHLAWIQTPRSEGGLGDMKIPVLADFNKDIANAFGVLDHETGISYRGLFLIDPSGEIRHSLVNDLSVGRSVDEAFRTLKAFQFVEKHGEVCPANWSDDKPTIKPGIKESKEYFKKVDGHT